MSSDLRQKAGGQYLMTTRRDRLVLTLVATLVVAGVVTGYAMTPQILEVDGKIAPGETVTATLGNVQLPWGCEVDLWQWEVRAPNYDSASYWTEGSTLEITSDMAGARLGLWLFPMGLCDKWENTHFTGYWDIPVNPSKHIENLVPPKLEGDFRPGGTLVVTPGVWTPADVDISYFWVPDYNTDFQSVIALKEYVIERDNYVEGAEAVLPLVPLVNTAVWAVVSYQDYPPIMYLVDSISSDTLEEASNNSADN